jgi:hypothetical protein
MMATGLQVHPAGKPELTSPMGDFGAIAQRAAETRAMRSSS